VASNFLYQFPEEPAMLHQNFLSDVSSLPNNARASCYTEKEIYQLANIRNTR